MSHSSRAKLLGPEHSTSGRRVRRLCQTKLTISGRVGFDARFARLSEAMHSSVQVLRLRSTARANELCVSRPVDPPNEPARHLFTRCSRCKSTLRSSTHALRHAGATKTGSLSSSSFFSLFSGQAEERVVGPNESETSGRSDQVLAPRLRFETTDEYIWLHDQLDYRIPKRATTNARCFKNNESI